MAKSIEEYNLLAVLSKNKSFCALTESWPGLYKRIKKNIGISTEEESC